VGPNLRGFLGGARLEQLPASFGWRSMPSHQGSGASGHTGQRAELHNLPRVRVAMASGLGADGFDVDGGLGRGGLNHLRLPGFLLRGVASWMD